jgi:hypothetical protein
MYKAFFNTPFLLYCHGERSRTTSFHPMLVIAKFFSRKK